MQPLSKTVAPILQARPNFETPGWLFIWGGLVGLFSGGVTVLYRSAVNWGNHKIWGGGEDSWGVDLIQIFLPALGGLAVGLFLYKYLRRQPGHGVPSVIYAISTNKTHIPWKISVPSFASVVILTSGGSAGPEGPAAEIGAVFGANTGKVIGAKPKTVRALIGAGVAGAIAAVFSAPIGGVFFALEVIFQGFELTLFAPVVMSAVVASIVSEIVFDFQPAIRVQEFAFNVFEFPLYIALGLLTGIAAASFIRWMEICSTAFQKVPLPLWAKPALGGLGVGLIGLFVPEVIGEGYEFLESELSGETVASTLALILIGKFLATGLTLGSGAPGGSFAPAIFIGGALGGLLGAVVDALAPGTVHPASYALIGIAGMIAGTFNAPMTAIMITLRITHGPEGDYEVLLPLMTTVAVTHFMMSRWENVSVYTQILKRHGQWFPAEYGKDPLLTVTVQEVLVAPRVRLKESFSVVRAMELIRDNDETVFVVDTEEGEFSGILTLNDLKVALADPLLGRLVTLGDVVDEELPKVSPDSTLKEAVHEFISTKVEALPVFDDRSHFLGIVTRDAVLEAYRNARREETDPVPSLD